MTQTGTTTKAVTIIRVRWTPGDAEDGSDLAPTMEDYRDADREVFEVDDIDDAVRVLDEHGLSFAATGTTWAADPDGSYIADYATGERVMTTGHLDGWTEDETLSIIQRTAV